MVDAAKTKTSAASLEQGPVDFTALSSYVTAKTWIERVSIVIVAIVVFSGLELVLRVTHVPAYVLPTPSVIFSTLFTTIGNDFVKIFTGEEQILLNHLLITVEELLIGFAIGATVGLVLAAVITQFPFVEKIISPYVLILVTTPMLALVPLLILKLGFGSEPRIIAVALAAFPMVMINSSTGFRRTDLNKIALAKSYGANTFQIFLRIRFPLALPMVFVGFMVGAIFGELTAVGAEMVGGKNGLGNRLAYFSSFIRMDYFFACIILLAIMGISLYLIFFFLSKKYASWEV